MNDIDVVTDILNKFDASREELTKKAFTPMAPPAPPATAMPPQGPPPGGPGMPPPGGAPMPPPGPPPGDPNMMPPPGDPGMGGAPMPPPPGPEAGAPPAGGGAVSPELESMLAQLAQGMGGVAQAMETQQANFDKLTDRVLQLEQNLSDMHDQQQVEETRESLQQPAGFEGGDPTDPAGPNAEENAADLEAPPSEESAGAAPSAADLLPMR